MEGGIKRERAKERLKVWGETEKRAEKLEGVCISFCVGGGGACVCMFCE